MSWLCEIGRMPARLTSPTVGFTVTRPFCVAGLTGSAVVCLSGQHPSGEDQLGSFQEAYGAEDVGPGGHSGSAWATS